MPDSEIVSAWDSTPPAMALANEIAFAYGIEPEVAVSWLAERANEFKHLNNFTADHLNQIMKVTP